MSAPQREVAERAAVIGLLAEARARTELLIAPIADEDLWVSHHPVMGPIAWDLGHIGQQEDLWLVQTLGGRDETLPDGNDLYDAYKHPRHTRASLPLMDKGTVRAYHDAVRRRALEVLDQGPRDPHDPLWRELFVHRMVVLHEHQHNETILQHLAAFPRGRYVPPRREAAPTAPAPPTGFARIPGGTFQMGVPARTPWTYDNEWDEHEVTVADFWLQRAPVTNLQFQRFIADGGYAEPRHWDPRGFRLVVEELGASAPLYWEEQDGGWVCSSFDRRVPLPPHHPVVHISWYEADAFARWAGARLPTEAEWEKAATWDDATGSKRTWPWGEDPPTRSRANLDQLRFGTDPVGSHPLGATPHGVHQLVGDVWEWTATPFAAYPDYEAFPYREYSEIFFDQDLMVLRGGSWATRPRLRLGTFRNWDLPKRRQVFAGLRLAADAPSDDPPTLPTPM